MDWKKIDYRLIRRGMLLLELGFVNNYGRELMRMNEGKLGRPFKLTNSYVRFVGVVRHLFSMGFRQLEGFTTALHKLVPRLPSIDYSWIRRRVLTLDLSPYQLLKESKEPVVIAIDASGVRVHKSRGWVEHVHGKKKRYINTLPLTSKRRRFYRWR